MTSVAREREVDPVCGMSITPTEAAAGIEYDGERYLFCSSACARLFEADPETYLEAPYPHLAEEAGIRLQRLPYGRATGEFSVRVEDPTDLKPGDATTYTKSFSERDVRLFAEISGDTNALHLDESFAEQARFGRRIVHGTLVSGLISAALACFPGVTIYLSQNVEYSRPVDLDQELTARCEIIETLERDRYRLTTRIENDAGDIVVHGVATVLIDPLPE
jgi:acyl dehydratase/YHS domain-containing protein